MKIVSDESRADMIFRHDNKDGKISYSVGISRKLEDGSYLKDYIPVKFKKGVVLENKTLINIKNGWLSIFENKDKEMVRYIFVSDFNIVSSGENTTMNTNTSEIKKVAENEVNSRFEVSDDELPF